MNPVELLEQYWGHKEFRPGQQEVIQAVLRKQDTLAVMPTGGGKSLCYQLPALMLPGICLVITPLVALMQDQVNGLKEKGIKAVAISGGIDKASLDRLLDNCIYGDYEFLFLSPERLQQDLVQGRIKQMKIGLVAIDEAHCISQWGHDFRPSYTKLTILQELAPEAPIIALTATANKAVSQDIAAQLLLKDPYTYKGSVLRENLSYQVKHTHDKYKALKETLAGNESSAIVYLRSRRGCEQLADWLVAQGIAASSYHGGVDTEIRAQRLNQWMESDSLVMVATNAFGMGIDKASVRNVIHFELPESLESYYQEAGRAGRDGKQALALLLTNEDDIAMAEKKYVNNLPDLKFVTRVYKKLQQQLRIAYGEGAFTLYNFDFGGFCHDYKLPAGKTYSSFQLLDRLGILRLNPVFSKQTKIRFSAPNDQLLAFFEENPKAGMLGQVLLRIYGGIAETAMNVSLKPLARQINRPEAYLLEQLEFMAKQGIIELELREADSEVTFLMPREDERTVNPFAGVIKAYHKQKLKQFNALLSYIKDTENCRQQLLASYFDEILETSCGLCDNSSATAGNNSGKRLEEQNLIAALKSGPKTRDQLAESLNFAPETVGALLQELIDQGLLDVDITGYFSLKV